jgi:hypothetical protein
MKSDNVIKETRVLDNGKKFNVIVRYVGTGTIEDILTDFANEMVKKINLGVDKYDKLSKQIK